MKPLPIKLNCTRCNEFTDYWGENGNDVVRCAECDKRHSPGSLYTVNPEKSYKRDESGELQEVPP